MGGSMKKRVAIVLVLATATVAGSTAGAATGATSIARRCVTRGTTILANQTARVFKRGSKSGDPIIYACERRGKRIVRLNEEGDFGLDAVFAFALAGHYLAYDESTPTGAASEDAIIVRDLRTGKLARVSVTTSPEYDDFQFDNISAHRIVLTPRGTVAWTVLDCTIGFAGACDGPGPTLHAVLASDGPIIGPHGGNVRVLARASTLSLTSLALSADARTVFWTVGGTPAGAPIH